MTRVLDSPKVDHAAVAAAVSGLCIRGATCQAYIRADGSNVCVNAVNAGGDGWSGYSEAASRRAATTGRRLLPVLDSGNIDGRHWIAYDMGSTTPLSDHRGRLLPTATSLGVLSDVARALDSAADDGVFAAELPPGSVFLAGRSARLGDLGTAREGLAGTEYELEGDPAYVAPEVLRGERAGERSGVYLFGALLNYLLAGPPAQGGPSEPSAGWRPELPASIAAIVAGAMADDPGRRPRSASDAHEMARRALRGEPPAPARRPVRRRPTVSARARRAPRLPEAPLGERRRPEAPLGERRSSEAPLGRRRRRKTPLRRPRSSEAPLGRRRRRKTPLRRPFRAVAIGGALLLGAATGLLLGGSPDPEAARVRTVRADDLSVTLPAGRHSVERGDRSLSVRAESGFDLRARLVSRPVEPQPGLRPVRLGALQAWRRAAPGVVDYAIPTSQGTLEVSCRGSASAASRPLRLCERTASTLELRDGRALPLVAAAEDSRRLRAALAALSAERDSARARLSRASTPSGQRLVAEDLAGSHRRAATALRELAGAKSVEAAARGAASAYSSLAAAAGSGSARRWHEASEQVSRSDAMLAEAIASAT